MRGLRRVILAAVGLLVAGTVQATAQPAAFAAPVVYDLGILPGQSWSEAYAINHEGYVVGRSGSQAVAWTPDLAIFRLPGLPGATASAIQSINYGRYGVGWSSVNGHLKAVQWPDLIGGGFALAPNYDGDTMALAINDQYEVFGLIKPTQPTNSAVWYAAQFTPSGVVRLNNPGYIVEDAVMGASNGPPGTNIIAGTTCRAVPCTFNYGYESGIGPPTSGGIMALPSITGSSHAKATDVGDDGTQIVGGSSTADGTGSHVTQWTLGHNSRGWPTWTLHDLGAPRTSDGSPGHAMGMHLNPQGTVIVGAARYTTDFGTGFYWNSRTGFVLLPTLDQANPCRNTFGARDVNDTFKIVGISCKGGARHAVEWRDIPVP